MNDSLWYDSPVLHQPPLAQVVPAPQGPQPPPPPPPLPQLVLPPIVLGYDYVEEEDADPLAPPPGYEYADDNPLPQTGQTDDELESESEFKSADDTFEAEPEADYDEIADDTIVAAPTPAPAATAATPLTAEEQQLLQRAAGYQLRSKVKFDPAVLHRYPRK